MKTRTRRAIEWKDMAGASTTDETGKVFGYLAAFGNVDDGRDRIHKGAFTKSIQERGPGTTTPRKIAYLYAHDMTRPIGRFTKLEEQEKGLYYEAELDPIPLVKDTLVPQMKSGTLNNHSIGYNYIFEDGKFIVNDKENVYELMELDLFEGSILPLGMNPDTPFGGFKKFLENTDDYKNLALSAEKLLKTLKSYSKEVELRTIITKYQSLLDSAAEEITAMKKQPSVPDMEYIIKNFKL